MPNSIKYSTSAQTLALKKGNFWIGTGDVGKGPTSTTDYYNGITPPSGGYTIYLNKASGGPSIYTAANGSQLISLSNTIAGQTFATAAAALDWFATQTDKMVFNIDYPAVITNGLVLNVDAGFTPSYPTTGTTWYDVSSGGNNGTLTNGPTFSSGNGGNIILDGTDDTISTPIALTSLPALSNFSLEIITKITQYPQPLSSPNVYGNTTRAGVLFGAAYYSGVALYWYGNSAGTACTIYSYIRGADAYRVTSGFSMITNNWYSFTLTNNYTGNALSLYANGTLIDSVNTATQEYNPDLAPSAGNIGFCKPQVDGGGELVYSYLNCAIASAKIYNRALSASEVLQNYKAQKGRFGL